MGFLHPKLDPQIVVNFSLLSTSYIVAPLTAAISQDEGETWIHSRHIADDPDGANGYQSVTFVGNMVVVSYHALDGLHVARIGIDWFYRKS